MLVILSLLACNGEDGDSACDTQRFYVDADGDGFGDLDQPAELCELEDGYSELAGDCDDNDETLTPDTQWFLDADGDGHGDPNAQIVSCEQQPGLVDNNGDCDDLDPSSNPEGVEVCDGADNDCNGTVDDEPTDGTVFYADADGDGDGDASATMTACEQPSGYVAEGNDCDDADGTLGPSTPEVCDGIDNDCDGIVDFDGWIPGDYATIQEALDAQIVDGHFCLDAGTHDAWDLEAVQSTTLEGQGSDLTILDGGEQANFMYAMRDLSLSGAHVQNFYADSTYHRGVYMESGDLLLQDVKFSDFTSTYLYGSYQSLVACGNPCSVELEGVEMYDITFTHDTTVYAYPTVGGALNTWGGDLVIRDSSFHDFVASGRYHYPLLQFWGNSAHLENVQIYGNTFEATNTNNSNYLRGPLLLETTSGAVVDGLIVEDNTYVAEASNTYLYGVFLGEILGYVDGAVVRNTEVVNNHVQGDKAYWAYGLFSYDWVGTTRYENVLFADNSIESLDYGYGVFYGVGELVNVDVVNNDFGSWQTWYGLIYSDYDTSVVNTNVVGNSASADSGAYGQLGYTGGDYPQLWSYSNVYGNSFPGDVQIYDSNTGEEALSEELYSFDPLYADEAGGDYTLGSGSPAIDAGDPAILDADGSTSDLGAYGGPYGDSW